MGQLHDLALCLYATTFVVGNSFNRDQDQQNDLCCFTSQSTAMVMAGRSVHLTTLFPGQARTSRLNQYFVHKKGFCQLQAKVLLLLVTANNSS